MWLTEKQIDRLGEFARQGRDTEMGRVQVRPIAARLAPAGTYRVSYRDESGWRGYLLAPDGSRTVDHS